MTNNDRNRPDHEVRAGLVFSALADSTRRSVLRAVAERDSTTATELAELVPVTRQAVTKHLGILAQAGLVRSDRIGRETRYAALPGGLDPAATWIAEADAAWAGRLDRLKRRVEDPPEIKPEIQLGPVRR